MSTNRPAGCACRDIGHLTEGIRAFKARHYGADHSLMHTLVEDGQAPATLMISCSDSRVDPAILTGAEPGELFAVRNVANLVPPYQPGASLHGTGAAIEYAVRDLLVDHIVIMGHAHCGGIKALISSAGGQRMQRDFINDWVEIALDACRIQVGDAGNAEGRREVSLKLLKENPFLVERAAIAGSLANLLTYPWLKERVDAGTLQLHGWWFDLETGDLWQTRPGETTLFPIV
ncbi:carbonic anhydrase [Pseudochelatococcus sp. B33]